MGSTGSGSFTDYSERRSRVSSGGSGGGAAGGPPLCDQIIDADLEEVERCAYYLTHHSLPAVGTPITVVRGARVTVLVGDLELGYLPTSYNYVVTCIEQGYTHAGTVTRALIRPVVRVSVNIVPVAPP